jgi:hypothetical protein
VYLYDAESTRGDARFAFRSIYFKNPTSSTLETGPVTVYGQGRFIGEGLTEAIPPRGTGVVPFALDRQVVVEKEESSKDRIAKLVKLVRGVLTTEVSHTRATSLKITNRQSQPVTVLIRHPVAKGWILSPTSKPAERYGDAHLFRVALEPSETKTLAIEESTPMTQTIDIRSPIGIDLVRLHLEAPQPDPQFAEAMRRLLKLYGELATEQEAIDNLRARGDEYRVRLDELHAQIISLEEVKTAGSLMTHLKTKMKEISERVQGNTLSVVDHQQKLMMAKVQFNEGVAELTLEKPKPASDIQTATK